MESCLFFSILLCSIVSVVLVIYSNTVLCSFPDILLVSVVFQFVWAVAVVVADCLCLQCILRCIHKGLGVIIPFISFIVTLMTSVVIFVSYNTVSCSDINFKDIENSLAFVQLGHFVLNVILVTGSCNNNTSKPQQKWDKLNSFDEE